VLQTEKKEERRNKDSRKDKREFFSGQKVSTDLPIFVDSKIQLPKKVMKDFLDYFGARKYESNRGYSAE